MDEILQRISQYGLVGLFGALVFGILGLPIPDETLLVFFGYLTSRGTFHPLMTWLTALAGSMGGITCSYVVGRTAGHGFIHRYGKYIHFTEERMERVLEWFDRIGHWLLTIGYYIPGIRHFTALVAGMSGMKYRSFALYAYPGALLWVSTFLTIGYLLGEKWEQLFENVHRTVSFALLALACGGFITWYFMSKRPPKKGKRSGTE
jgi:membrane protein DedA with SNARE-associated domain